MEISVYNLDFNYKGNTVKVEVFRRYMKKTWVASIGGYAVTNDDDKVLTWRSAEKAIKDTKSIHIPMAKYMLDK